MKGHPSEQSSTWLTRAWQPLVTAAAVAVLPLGVGTLAPPAAVAISATWGETITLTSILTGYESILLGLEEVDMGGEVKVFEHFLTFSETFAAFTMTGTIGDMHFTLDGSGLLAGEVGSEDLTWTGNWLGTLGGTSIIFADEVGNLTFDAVDGYTQLDFFQFGAKDFDLWDATTTGELTSDLGGSLLPGWSGPGKGDGIGGTISAAKADLETLLFPSGNVIGSFLAIDGDAQSFKLALDDGTLIKEGNYTCEENKNCIKTQIPEPTSPGSFFLLFAFGIMRPLCGSQKEKGKRLLEKVVREKL